MTDLPMFLTRPKSADIYNYLVDAERPLTVKEISTFMQIPYNTVKYHVKLMESEGHLEQIKLTDTKKEKYYKPTGTQKLSLKTKENLAQWKMYWAPLSKSASIQEIIQTYNEKDVAENKTFTKDIYVKLIKNHMKDVISLAKNTGMANDPKLIARFKQRREDIYRTIDSMREFLKMIESITEETTIQIYDPDEPMKAVRILIDEDPDCNPELLHELLNIKDNLWEQENLNAMADWAEPWIIALFIANWNEPVILDDLDNILSGIEKGKILRCLETAFLDDEKVFRKVGGSKLPKWQMALVDYYYGPVKDIVRLINNKQIIQRFFQHEPRDIDRDPLVFQN